MKKLPLLLAAAVCPLLLEAQTVVGGNVAAGEEEGEWEIALTLESEENVVGLQMDLQLPDSTREAEARKTSRTAGLTLMQNRLRKGALRILAYSQKAQPIEGTSGEVFTVRLTAPGWEATALSLSNIHVTLEGNRDLRLPDTTLTP